MEEETPNTTVVRQRQYELINQKVDIDVDFSGRITGYTHLTISPETPALKGIVLHARQSEISSITINGLKPAVVEYRSPYDVLDLHIDGSVHHHHILSEKLDDRLNVPPTEELTVLLPTGLHIRANPEFLLHTETGVKTAPLTDAAVVDGSHVQTPVDVHISRYTKLEVIIHFTTEHTRDAIQFATHDRKWPHVYTYQTFQPGRPSCIFPCMDSLYRRCSWEITIRAPRNVGDALRQIHGSNYNGDGTQTHEAREMRILCSGEITDDMIDEKHGSKRVTSFAITQSVAAQQIGFAIGPFSEVDLTSLRDTEKTDLLQENAAPIMAYCLPGREKEVENTCLPLTEALDHFVLNYSPYPFTSLSYCFVDDANDRFATFAGLLICTTRILYPDNVIDVAQESTRTLVQALTSQWLGVYIIPETPFDTWAVVGASLFMAEAFMKVLCGENEYRFRMKQMSDRVCDLDRVRPSIWETGRLLHVDPSEFDFLALKAPLVMFILDCRIAKVTGSGKMGACIGKILSRARNEDLRDNLLSTDEFAKVVEKALHGKIDTFLDQWVKGAGTPIFHVKQKFNKKKLVVEIEFRQIQNTEAEIDDPEKLKIRPENFMKNAREEIYEVYATPPRAVFTGPMTIRVHEADGTPYEHIVEIKEAVQTFEVPYSTKYKRLRRGRRQRQRAANRAENEEEAEALVYCLGDVLQDDEDLLNWHLEEPQQAMEEAMSQESYEWIRIDADFEWICKSLIAMPGYMFLSQLQQDRDVAAQLSTIQHIRHYFGLEKLFSTMLVRTVADERYFHGIRTAAAMTLVKYATEKKDCGNIGYFHLRKAYEELYTGSGNDTKLTKPNNFSNQQAYILQCALITAISQVRSDDGHTPRAVKEFLLEKLKFNDNSANNFSDAHYVANLIRALTDALIARPKKPAHLDLEAEVALEFHELETFEMRCIEEIDRYRRTDEWINSYQNLYTTTALACQAQLLQAGIAKYPLMHFLQFTRPGNYELIRSTAYSLLASLDLFDNASVLRYLIHCMISDRSLWVRTQAQHAFGRALARVAVGIKPAATQEIKDLVIEEMDVDQEPDDPARQHNIEVAITALAKQLGDDSALQEFLWWALSFPHSGYEDKKIFLEYCRLLFTTTNEFRLRVSLPRYWSVYYEGNGRVKFSRKRKIRTKPIEPWTPKLQQVKVPLKLNFGKRKASMPASSIASSAKSSASPQPPPNTQPRQVIKLKLGSMSG